MNPSPDKINEAMRRRQQFVVLEKQVAWKTVKRHKSDHPEFILDSPGEACSFLEGVLDSSPVELLYAVALNARNSFLGCTRLASGSVDRASVHPRLLISFLLNINATGVILAHNHPGGVARASSEDISLTNRLGKLLKDLDIKLLDHLIFAPGTFERQPSWVSLKQDGVLG